MAVGDVTMPQMHVGKRCKIGSTEAYVRYQNRRDLVILSLQKVQMLRVYLLKTPSVQHLFMSLKLILPKAILVI